MLFIIKFVRETIEALRYDLGYAVGFRYELDRLKRVWHAYLNSLIINLSWESTEGDSCIYGNDPGVPE